MKHYEYRLYYIGHNNTVIECTAFSTLEQALEDCYYWLNNSSVTSKLSHVRIYHTFTEYEVITKCIAEIHR